MLGSATEPAEGIEASSVTLNSTSGVLFEIAGSGTTAQTDYSQLTSDGPVGLAGTISVVVGQPTEKASCPVLTPGSTYTLLSTTGTLTGTFANAPEARKYRSPPESCTMRSSGYLRITYDRSGSTQSVIATVPGATEIPEPEKQYEPYEKPNAGGAERDEISSAQAIAEARAKEQAAEAAAKERQAHEEAERKALAAQQEQQAATSMLASPLTSDITVQRDGAALVELECTGSAADKSCAGKLTLSVQATRKSGERSRTVTVTIATAQFSIGAGKTATVHIDLNKVGTRAAARGSRPPQRASDDPPKRPRGAHPDPRCAAHRAEVSRQDEEIARCGRTGLSPGRPRRRRPVPGLPGLRRQQQ